MSKLPRQRFVRTVEQEAPSSLSPPRQRVCSTGPLVVHEGPPLANLKKRPVKVESQEGQENPSSLLLQRPLITGILVGQETPRSSGWTQKEDRRRRKRQELSPATLMISFGLFPVLLSFYLFMTSIMMTKPTSYLWNPFEGQSRKIVTAFIEPSETFLDSIKPLPARAIKADQLTSVQFPHVTRCSNLWETFPIDAYPTSDPFLPWIHDFFPSIDGSSIQFVAQNRRRCAVGDDRTESMKFWEPQLALFQPVPVVQDKDGRVRLASTFQEATVNETRFICRFHTNNNTEYITFSEFPFNYEYISWRKGHRSMIQITGKDNQQFWLSQLMFHCPVPKELQHSVARGEHVVHDMSQLWLDLIPIRTPTRNGVHLFTEDHIGPELLKTEKLLDLQREFGKKHYLPHTNSSGRWANLPICLPPPKIKRHKLTVCTWTSASYTRRGDAVTLGDTEARLREWLLFQRLVGVNHVVLYDNTAPKVKVSSLKRIAHEFPGFVTYHRWPCVLCSNNRPNHRHPGERSSQYAAEASCRERYGPSTDWMSFIDTDEYLVPMGSDTWQPILEKFEERNLHILKMRSSRAKPRIELMDELKDQSTCPGPGPDPGLILNSSDGKAAEPCIGPRHNETFLHVYNCEFIRPPRPNRFERAMKQIYRPDHVLNHFVHYSTVTTNVARLYKDFDQQEKFERNTHRISWKKTSPEIFLDDINEGMLIHTRSVLPHETKHKSSECALNSKHSCNIGHLCPDETLFVDTKHKANTFTDADGKYCNCWRNAKVEDVYVPLLDTLIKTHMKMIN